LIGWYRKGKIIAENLEQGFLDGVNAYWHTMTLAFD
jgi:hypothetical protein